MSWFMEMKSKYAPMMTPAAFDAFLSDIEDKLFKEHPEYLKQEEALSNDPETLKKLENEQNLRIEMELRKAIV